MDAWATDASGAWYEPNLAAPSLPAAAVVQVPTPLEEQGGKQTGCQWRNQNAGEKGKEIKV